MNKFLSILHLIFIRPIEILVGISGLIIRFVLISPLFLIQNLITGAIIIWIYGQVVALVTAHQFLPASYFDISKYPSYVQEVLQTKNVFLRNVELVHYATSNCTSYRGGYQLFSMVYTKRATFRRRIIYGRRR